MEFYFQRWVPERHTKLAKFKIFFCIYSATKVSGFLRKGITAWMSVQGKASGSPKCGHIAMPYQFHSVSYLQFKSRLLHLGYKSWVGNKQILKRTQDGTTQEVGLVWGSVGLACNS